MHEKCFYQSRSTSEEGKKLKAEQRSVKGKQIKLLWGEESRPRGTNHKTGQMN